MNKTEEGSFIFLNSPDMKMETEKKKIISETDILGYRYTTTKTKIEGSGGEKVGICAFPNCDNRGILRANGKIKCEQHYYSTDSKPSEFILSEDLFQEYKNKIKREIISEFMKSIDVYTKENYSPYWLEEKKKWEKKLK